MTPMKHGGWKHYKSTYQCWQDMKQRCLNKRHRQYKNYGGRGIYICDSWLSGFENFFQDMGEKPPGMTLDRIDNDGPYFKANCRWATPAQQRVNTRACVHLEFNGQRMTVEEWGRHIGRHPTTVRSRLRAGWTLSDILDPNTQFRGKYSAPRIYAAMKG